MVSARLPPALIDQIEAWAKRQKTSRSDAIRRLLEAGLNAAQRR
jgi:metal-responsive CopG/Arc/MetJ family transcriptional regulator